ncbi:hypothetical protein B9Z55_010324 [Caenorhabditis nigoni]|uniref:Uncharacterized protein n=1 Tax=Caenorhabditis nigoni TaxID=1611254 RepID=A0A2G5UFI0_9PELO|nr:hypothetical protein B9Z55_010324 [Caenorhabditis nigoni]
MFSLSSPTQLSRETVSDIVHLLESQCLDSENFEKCEKIYLKLNSNCVKDRGGLDKKCELFVYSIKNEFCRRNGRKALRICGRTKKRDHDTGFGTNLGGHGHVANPTRFPGPQGPPQTQPPPPAQTPKPPEPQQPPPVLPPPPPPAPEPSNPSSSSKGTLLIGMFIFGMFVCVGISAVVGYLYYMKQQEKAKEEERKKLEQSKMMEKKKKRKMRKKKSKKVIVQVTGEETRVERKEAKDKDREEEASKWKAFEEANQKENTFLNPS